MSLTAARQILPFTVTKAGQDTIVKLAEPLALLCWSLFRDSARIMTGSLAMSILSGQREDAEIGGPLGKAFRSA